MALGLLIFGVSLAALCVWLAVRIINRRERWAKRTAVGLATASVFVSAYATAYMRMVRASLPDEYAHFSTAPFGRSWRIELIPDYQWYDPATGSFAGDQRFWEVFFAPAHWIDRRMRPDKWVIGNRDDRLE